MKKLRKLFKNPKRYFRDMLINLSKKTIGLVGKEQGKKTLYLYHFSNWKKDFLPDWFPNNQLVYLPFHLSEQDFIKKYKDIILEDMGDGFLIWGTNAPDYLLEFVLENNIQHSFVEDGFLRSKQLGIEYVAPASLIFDKKALYFDCSKPSELENILAGYDFQSTPDLLQEARSLITFLVGKGISKYNQVSHVATDLLYGEKNKKRILVIGQVEHDASIKYGCHEPITNKELVEIAIQENPDAQIIYKPHPDVLKKHGNSLMKSFKDSLWVLEDNISLADAFRDVDHVYTITSLVGLEALMRNIKVTTLGCPFYSGWGLTDDRQVNLRRQRHLSIEELIAAAYILYPRYFHPYTKEDTSAEKIAYFLYSC